MSDQPPARARALPLAILAGGLGTRLGPATADTPKALVEVAGRPFIYHQLWLAKRSSLTFARRVVLCVGHYGEKIEAYVGDGSRWGLDVRYSHDGDRLLGTAGALRQALPLLGDTFFVLYGDSYLDALNLGEMADLFARRHAIAMMSVCHNRNQWERSNCLVAGGKVLRYDKRDPQPDMEYVDYGLAVMTPQALNLPPVSDDVSDIYARLAAAGHLHACIVRRRFHEIGSPQGRDETERYIRELEARERALAARENREVRPWTGSPEPISTNP